MRALLHGGTDANAATVATTVDVAVTADGSALAPRGTAWPG